MTAVGPGNAFLPLFQRSARKSLTFHSWSHINVTSDLDAAVTTKMTRKSAERVRRMRERRKELLKTLPDQTQEYAQHGFAAFIGEDSLIFEEPLDRLGVRIEGLHDEEFTYHSDSAQGTVSMPALNRATALVGVLIDAATELASLVNAFKLKELDRKIEEIRVSDMSDPEQRQALLDEMVRLAELRKKLDGEFRRPFRLIEVKE